LEHKVLYENGFGIPQTKPKALQDLKGTRGMSCESCSKDAKKAQKRIYEHSMAGSVRREFRRNISIQRPLRDGNGEKMSQMGGNSRTIQKDAREEKIE